MDAIDKSCEDLYETKVLHEIPLRLGRDEMLRRTGLGGRKRRPAPSLLAEFEGIAREVESGQLVRPAAVLRIVQNLDITPDHVVIAGGARLSGNLVFRKARNATHLGLAICTIGKDLEERASEAGKEDLFRRVILDGIGSVAADALMVEVSNMFPPIAAKMNLAAGSPLLFGMPGLPLTDLAALFDLLPVQEIGVQLTSSFSMVPQKTCAFVVGIGPAMPTWSKEQACRQCTLHGICRYRK